MWICPKCDAYNDTENVFCAKCSASRFNKKYKRAAQMESDIIGRTDAVGRRAAGPTGRLKSSTGRRSETKTGGAPCYCGNCGCHITEEARFCPKCGAKL